jgi:putative ABC transport system permease protein
MTAGLMLVFFALPAFNTLTGKEIVVGHLLDAALLVFLFLILLFVGFVSGSYPAFYISRYQPAHVLRRAFRTGAGRSMLRKGLVVMQFSISIALIIATGIVLDQLDFLKNRKLGFEKEHVVVVPIRAQSIRTNSESVKAELMQNPAIYAATATIGVPGGTVAGDAIQLLTEEGKKTITVRMIYTDHDYIRTMGMKIVRGRDFSKAMSTDADDSFIVNQAAVRALNLDEPLKARFEWGDKKGSVIGVVEDFQFQSLRHEIDPLIITIAPRFSYVFAMRIDSDNISRTLAFIERTWTRLDPAHPFEYAFMDETFDKLYHREENLSKIFRGFSLLAILIAALGLFGLALFMVEQRAKEIGIRKVLGASIAGIFYALTREFALLVLAANVIAWPIAFIFMSRWLENFAYRVDIRLEIFLMSALAALGAALLTISYHCLKSALSDPVKSLRHE